MIRTPTVLLVALCPIMAILADEISLVRMGEPWRFRLGTNEASVPLDAWRQRGFDDSSWIEGPAGFSLAGGEATLLPSVATYHSVYFRKRFTVMDPGTVKWLVLRMDYNDGFVAYLNDAEIARANLVGDPVPFDAPALAARALGAADDIDVSASASRLVAGENVLAIQIHNSYLYDGTLGLVPELLANFQRGPFIQNVTSNSVQIIWRTPAPSDTVVEYGTDVSLGLSISDSTAVVEHAVTLPGLLPGARYYYRVRSSIGPVTAVSPVFWFDTAKASGDVIFMVLGDSGGAYTMQYRVAGVLADSDADLVLHTGDIIYGSFVYGRADTRFLSVYGRHMRHRPYYFTIGNHELYSFPDGSAYFNTVYMPTNSATGTEHYYSFDYGDAHFVSLCVPVLSMLPGYTLAEGNAQYRWLTNDLAHSAKPWKILFFHSPFQTSSAHRYDNYNGNGVRDPVEIHQMLAPVAERYGVQLIFNGHDHNYERFNPVSGVCSIVTGGGGYTLYSLSERDAASSQFWHRYHCVRVHIQGESMALQAIDQFGEVFDTMTLRRSPPPRQTWASAWHSPRVEAQPADDDGNITGQTFDLAGTPIPAVSGRFSNLGQVYVNNDAVNLYIGFRQAMLGADANIFLFIQSPRLTGVSSLTGLGNGMPDPFGQGVDGLDFLENLSFTNFSPAIACVLGDEYADGQYRAFARPGLPVDIGQGVYRLDPGFSDVAAAWIQQFNISPQLRNVAHQGTAADRNADLVEIAIPYAALGGMQPGDWIKLGSVVGGSDIDIFDQLRGLDSGFLGVAMSGSGRAAVALEGVSVQLADYPPDADSDGDGLLDRWEAAHGLNPVSAAGVHGAAGDPDGDGFTNLEEQFAGTDPRDAGSALWMSLTPLEPGRFRIEWQAVPGRLYTLLWANRASGPFGEIPAPTFPRTAVADTETYDLDLSGLNPQPATLFLRVRVLP